MNKLNFILAFFILITIETASAQIQTVPAAKPAAGSPTGITTKKSKASDRLKLEFEEDLVEGGLENTELNFIQMRKENNFKKMIKIRENFIPEIEGSSSELGSK